MRYCEERERWREERARYCERRYREQRTCWLRNACVDEYLQPENMIV